MKKNRFDIDYSKWIRQIEVTKDDSVWDEIQDELDFIETWDNISAKLNKVKPLTNNADPIRYRKILIATAAIFLILILPIKHLNDQVNYLSNSSEPSNQTYNKEALPSNKPNTKTATNEKEETVQVSKTEIFTTKNSSQKQPTALSENQSATITGKEHSEDTLLWNKEFAMSGIQNLPLDTKFILSGSYDIPLDAIEIKPHFVPEPMQASTFSFAIVEAGLVYGYKNTWLLNYETRNGLNPEKLGETLPTFHQDIGVSSTLAFKNRHLFGLEFFWKSKAGQNYRQYINASFVQRNISLDYLKLQAFYVRNFERLPGEAIFGGYIASLTTAEDQREYTKFSINNSYSDHDFGLLAGYQFIIALKNKIIVKPGVRLNYNLINIFEGDDVTPGYLKDTKNFAASFNLSFSYKFRN